MSDSWYIPAERDGDKHVSLASMGHLVACHKCKKKIMVSMGINGTIHHSTPSVVCAECLEVPEDFATKHPDIAAQIAEWKAGS